MYQRNSNIRSVHKRRTDGIGAGTRTERGRRAERGRRCRQRHGNRSPNGRPLVSPRARSAHPPLSLCIPGPPERPAPAPRPSPALRALAWALARVSRVSRPPTADARPRGARRSLCAVHTRYIYAEMANSIPTSQACAHIHLHMLTQVAAISQKFFFRSVQRPCSAACDCTRRPSLQRHSPRRVQGHTASLLPVLRPRITWFARVRLGTPPCQLFELFTVCR